MIEFLVKPLINPLVPAVVYIFWRFIRGGLGRKHISYLFLYLYIITMPATWRALHYMWVVPDSVIQDHTYDAVVVLSGVVPKSLYLSYGKHGINNLFRYSRDFDRVYAGLKFIHTKNADRLFIGDDVSGSFHEADVVEQFLLENGVNQEKIVIYGVVGNTYDEAQKIGQIVRHGELRDFILVTSERHMRRAANTFGAQELNPALFSTDRKKLGEITAKDFFPNKYALSNLKRISYEIVAYIGYWLRGWI